MIRFFYFATMKIFGQLVFHLQLAIHLLHVNISIFLKFTMKHISASFMLGRIKNEKRSNFFEGLCKALSSSSLQPFCIYCNNLKLYQIISFVIFVPERSESIKGIKFHKLSTLKFCYTISVSAELSNLIATLKKYRIVIF